MILCLYNSYDKLRLHDIHARSVARAAPVCYALSFHLILLDFPTSMYDHVITSTTIGESGKYLSALKALSHFSELTKRLPLETLVVTTSKPDEEKMISCQLLADMYIKGEKLAFIVGLGRRGPPMALRKKATYHWDVTGKGISLETCTAIGYVAAKFSTVVEFSMQLPSRNH